LFWELAGRWKSGTTAAHSPDKRGIRHLKKDRPAGPQSPPPFRTRRCHEAMTSYSVCTRPPRKVLVAT
jgi:hypothetical protein